MAWLTKRCARRPTFSRCCGTSRGSSPAPVLIGLAVDGGAAALLPWLAGGLLASFLGQALVGLATAVLLGGVGLDVVRDLRRQVYDCLHHLDLSFHHRHHAD